jgi:hypothetical protein
VKVEIVKCDVCGVDGAKTCYFHVDRKMDAAGSMDDEHESMDLCDEHAWQAYLKAQNYLSFEERRGVVDLLRADAAARGGK